MFMIDYKQLAWWYWLITVSLLTAGLAGYPAGFPLAIGCTALQAVHFAFLDHSIKSFRVQVRLGYLVLLLVALPKPLQFIYWAPAVGTWAQVITGYCMMARIMSLMPWNRKEPLSASLLRRTFFSPPVRGNILQGLPPVSSPAE